MSKETPENTTISSAQDFKKQREAREAGDVLTLASGLTVRLRRPDITVAIAKGLVPSNILQTFMKLQGQTKDAVEADDIQALLSLQRIMAELALVEPKVVNEPDYGNGEISIDDLESSDLDEIWNYVNGGIASVELFRKKRTSGTIPGPDSDKIPEPQTE